MRNDRIRFHRIKGSTTHEDIIFAIMPYLALGSIASVKAGLSANCGSAERR